MLCLLSLAPLKPAGAAASLSLGSNFTSADAARANAYMDSGGTWNGTAEVTDTTGDSFVFSVQNTAVGLPADDSAFDLAVTLDVQSGFRLAVPLPTASYAVSVINTAGAGCTDIDALGVTATQPGGAGTQITVNIPADTDILPGCDYDFEIGLTTDDTPPSVSDGFYAVDFDLTYNEIDDDAGSARAASVTENVEVRNGDVALLKTAVTANAGDGDTVEFTVSILGAGSGGIFDVELTDTPGADFDPGSLVIQPPVGPPLAPGVNQYTIDYIAPGEQVDVTIFADVSVDPAAVSCPDLRNDADVEDRLNHTSSFFDSVPFDLENPFIEYTPPNVNVPFGAAGIDVTVPVQNTGLGAAKNISLSAANLGVAGYSVTVDNLASPNWSYAGGVFTYTGTLAAGEVANLVYNLSVVACPAPAGQSVDWVPAYQNACGTDFFPPLRFSTTSVGNIPDADITKNVSAGSINIGNPGFYTLALGGTNITNLPDDGVADNQDFTVTDTLPVGITNAVINAIPATTEVFINASVTPYVAGTPIPDNATITWRGDRDDLLALPTLQIDFVGGGVCPPGINIGNTATIDYPTCSNNSGAAGFILNENPAGAATTNISVGGDGDFEAGAPDTDGAVDTQVREGEHIPFTVSYSFPPGFTGNWSGTSFRSQLRSNISPLSPLVLTNNGSDVHLQVIADPGGAATVVCDADLAPGDFTGGDGSGPLVITDFGALTPAGCSDLGGAIVSVQNHDVIITYEATSPEGELDGDGNPTNQANIGGYLEQTTLTVNAGPLSCLGNSEFIQATNVNIERATLDLSATINNGNPASVCEVVPVSINVTGPAADTTSDNFYLQFDDTSFEVIDVGADANLANDFSYGGSLSALNLTPGQAASIIQFDPASINDVVTADGSVTFNARLRDNVVPGTMDVQLEYDSNHTSPNGSINDTDRDFTIPITAAPPALLSGQLDMEFFPPDLILLDSTNYAFKAQITNVGTGLAVNSEYRITLPPGMTFNTSTQSGAAPVVGPVLPGGQLIEWDIGDLAAGSSYEIDIEAVIDRSTCFQPQGPGTEIISENEWGCGSPIINTVPGTPGIVLAPNQLTLTHDTNNSFCILCDEIGNPNREGEIRLFVTNTGSVLLTDVEVTEDLGSSGLTYVPNSTTYFVDGVAGPAPLSDPVPFGASLEQVTWTQAEIPELAELYSAFGAGPGQPQQIEIRFRVVHNPAVLTPRQDLVTTDRSIQASADFGLFCGPPPQTATSTPFELPLRQPAPVMRLEGRNVDAGQADTQYTADVFGGASDDVIWRMTVANNNAQARADLENLLQSNDYSFISKTINPGVDTLPNFNINAICNSEANADAVATGGAIDGVNCITPASIGGTATSVTQDVDDPFGNPDDDEATLSTFIDTLQGGFAQIYFVGRMQTLCNVTGVDGSIQWGCELDQPNGGTLDTSYTSGGNPAVLPSSVVDADSQISGSDVDAGDVLVTHTITGSDGGAELGAKGILTISITNNAQGSVANVTLTDVLPPGYALDITQVDNPGVSDVLLNAVNTTPAFGSVYDGMVDTATVTNLDAVTFEDNITLDISLTSSTNATVDPGQENLIRAGDVVQLTINIVKISGFDIVADPDIEDETAGNGADPAVVTPLENRLTVDIRNTCAELVGTIGPDPGDDVFLAATSVVAGPEDLDITINRGDANKTYVISNPTDTLVLDVEVNNNGLHDADDHFILVTMGSGLEPDPLTPFAVPPACTEISTTPDVDVPRPVWIPSLPGSGRLYRCDAGSTITQGDTRNYLFTVRKSGAGADLTFRADVVGEIVLQDGATALTYPAPANTGNSASPIDNVANNYSLDSVRARIIGFNLVKTVSSCSEQGAFAPGTQAADVTIGEDCTYRLSAGWFGFTTPGFGQVSIGNVIITDDLDDDGAVSGQGFISQSETIVGAGVVSDGFTPTPAVGAPGEIQQGQWSYNAGAVTITNDFTIDIDLVTRTLNTPTSAAANSHGDLITNELNAQFDVDFDGPGGQPPVTFTDASPNFPPITDRQVDTTITEPDITVTKTVCNESINGGGDSCTDFQPLRNDGDTNDTYVYRLEIANAANRATAFDVDIVDTVDNLLIVIPPGSDGIDNDGDGLIDALDADELAIAISDNTAADGNPGVMTIPAGGLTGLDAIAANTTVTLYFRVDPDDTSAPGQVLTNSAVVGYDTLTGASGSQAAPTGATGTAAGARLYSEAAAIATIEITDLAAPADSKAVLQTSRFNAPAPPFNVPELGPIDVVIGEEIEFQLKIEMPISQLDNFTIRDELPAGLSCIEAQTIDLNGTYTNSQGDTTDYGSAGFVSSSIPADSPVVVPTCTDSLVEWNFGNWALTTGPTFEFTATFIARVENDTVNVTGNSTINGGASTNAFYSYDDAGGFNQTVPVRAFTLNVTEPDIQLTKSYAVVNADGQDRLLVTVDVENTDNFADAYNVRVWDNLDDALVDNVTYVPGSDSAQVTEDVATFGNNSPLFTLVNPVAPNSTTTFTYQVDIDTDVQPLEVLNSRLEADWTSLPDASTALNSGGSIDADGTAAGMRNGAIPNAGNTLNDYEAAFIENTLTVPGVTINKVDVTPSVPAEIAVGETKAYRLEIALPEGVTDNLSITDNLAAAGVDSYTLQSIDNYTYQGIATINASAQTDGVATGWTAVPVAGATGNILWDIGSVVTQTAVAPATVSPLITIEYTVRADNSNAINDGDLLQNSATAGYNDGETGLPTSDGPVTTPQLTVVEPLLVGTKDFTNVTPGKLATDAPDGGDIIEYTLTISHDPASTAEAFDVSVVDTLPAALSWDSTVSATIGGADIIAGGFNPVPLNQPAGPLVWGLGNGGDDLVDIPLGQELIIVYRVTLTDTVLADLNIDNSVLADWTSIDGADAGERTGAGCPAVTPPNDYCTDPPIVATLSTSDNNDIVKNLVANTSPLGAAEARVGDVVDYELRATIQEGTSPNVVFIDQLPQGIVFEQVLSVNGDNDGSDGFTASAPFTHAVIPDVTTAGNVTGDPATGPTTLTITVGNVVNAADNNLPVANDEFVITYRARVLNGAKDNPVIAPTSTLVNNTGNLDYDTATAAGIANRKSESENLTVQQPDISIAKTKLVTAASPDNIIDNNELITYRIDITNNSLTGPAYDIELHDVIPVGLRNGAASVTTLDTQLPVGNDVADIAPAYSAASGLAVWNFDAGIYAIPPGDTLRLEYQVQADANIAPGLTLENRARVESYYSFDDGNPPQAGVTNTRQEYGPTPDVIATLFTPAADPLDKQNLVTGASIGEPFSYRITVPDPATLPSTTALNDVRILDNLGLSAADLEFVSVTRVSGSQPWTPVNVGTATDIIIQDSGADGIDIPAGETIELDITVQLRDQPVNTATPVALQFNNTASYTFNQVDGDPGTQGVTVPVVTTNIPVVEPFDMTTVFDGPATMQFGAPGSFTMDVENTGTGPAWDMTLTAVLDDTASGGLCDTTPVVTSAQVFDNTGTVTVGPVLVEGADFVTSYTGAPACTFTVTMQTADTRVGAGERLIVSFDAELDLDTLNATTLNSFAGATEWFSADTPAGVAVDQIRTYTRTLTDGSPGNANDFEDDHDVVTESPILSIRKTVENLTSGQDPGFNAEPGDILRYTITITNTGPVGIPDFSFTDEPDRLTSPPGIFVPGSMSPPVITAAPGFTDNTNLTGGANGAGLVDVQDIALDAAGGANDTVVIAFDVTLRSVLPSGVIASNQAEVVAPNFSTLLSDDPNDIAGPDDPLVFGDEFPTNTLIGSVPAFRFEKTSTDLTGDPNVLAQGDTLRYTITAKNIGVENAINTFLRDQVPANTAYVAGSTTLNGSPVADPAAGVSPLQDGILINAPEDATPGNMRADPSATPDNIATIVFDVVVASDIINGTIISNQAQVTGEGVGSGAFPSQLSDDPDTDVIGDPTQDIIGNLPILDVQKTVMLVTPDGGTPDQVDNGDTLRYTFRISNAGNVDATGVVLTDNVPTNTGYDADSMTLNGIAFNDPVTGTLPLIAGIDIGSGAALPTPGNGTVSAGASATVTFDVTVTGAAGQLVTNQATLASNELPDELSDVDGNDENGDQPTVIAIGNVQQLAITKEVQVVGGGTAAAGGRLEYIIRVQNTGTVNVTDVVISDDLNPLSGQLAFAGGSERMNGSANGVGIAGNVLTANFGATYGDLEPGDAVIVNFSADISSGLATGASITNTAGVSWNTATQNDSDTASVDIGSAPGIAALSGTAWHDADFDNQLDSGERLLEGWSVEIWLAGSQLDSVFTDVNGQYNLLGLIPSDVAGGRYELRYVAPGAGVTSALLGLADSTASAVAFTDDLHRIGDIGVSAGSYRFNLNLPIDPNGVVYDAILRTPVAGVPLTLVNSASATALPASCFDDPNQQNQVTLADGYYKFDLNFSQAGICDPGDDYYIQIGTLPTGYVGTTSLIMPTASDLADPAFDVTTCPGSAADQLTTSPDRCEVQVSEQAPATSVLPRTPGTTYHLHYRVNGSTSPYTRQIFNNHIPVDPELDEAIAVSKTSAMLNVTRSQLVPYTITLSNTLSAPIQDLDIVDNFPAGFKYVANSARLDDIPTEPAINGLQMTWPDLSISFNQVRTLKMLLVAGAGVSEGEYVNTAQAINNRNGQPASEVASATVRVVPDPTFDCTDIIGKVFDDANLNGYQDQGEGGLPGARVVTARGIEAITDEHGRFHITCAAVPNEDRGSNFILKLDERSLPSGYRVTTENPRVERATRGKMLKFGFGAAIHRVVRLDMADGVFEPDSTELRVQWLQRISLLMERLTEKPSILRLAYMGDVEDPDLVEDRLQAMKSDIEERWEELDCCYRLEIETEVYWRRGKPASLEVFDD